MPGLDMKKRAFRPWKVVSEDELDTCAGSLPRGCKDSGDCCWSLPSPHQLRIRGKAYLNDRKKVTAGEPRMQLAAVDWLTSNVREDDVTGRPGSAAQRLRLSRPEGSPRPFILAVNLQVPGATTYSYIMYYALDAPLASFPLLERFVNGDDEFRNSRFKLIPSIAKGTWAVKQTVGTKPCLLGRALQMNYFHGKDYLEVGVNIGSSMVARRVVGLVVGCLKTLVIDLSIVLQADTEEELPEDLLGACQLCHIDITQAAPAPNKALRERN